MYNCNLFKHQNLLETYLASYLYIIDRRWSPTELKGYVNSNVSKGTTRHQAAMLKKQKSLVKLSVSTAPFISGVFLYKEKRVVNHARQTFEARSAVRQLDM